MYSTQWCSERVGCWVVRKKIDGRLDIVVLLRSERCTPYDAQFIYGDRRSVNNLSWGFYNTVMVVSPCLFSDDWNTARWIQSDFVWYIGSIHDTIACCVLTLWTQWWSKAKYLWYTHWWVVYPRMGWIVASTFVSIGSQEKTFTQSSQSNYVSRTCTSLQAYIKFVHRW